MNKSVDEFGLVTLAPTGALRADYMRDLAGCSRGPAGVARKYRSGNENRRDLREKNIEDSPEHRANYFSAQAKIIS